MVHELTFQCPLASGMHARPASQLADVASRFAAEVTLVNERTAASANAKSVLAIVALDVKLDDPCRLRFTGANADAAKVALADFITNVLPRCDEPSPAPAPSAPVSIPRSLQHANVHWRPGTPVCPGIAHGRIVIAGGLSLPTGWTDLQVDSTEQEQEKVWRAIRAVRAALEARLALRPSGVECGILQAQLSMACDVALGEKVGELISAGDAAGPAIVKAARHFAEQFRAAESVYIRERAVDVEDIGLHLLEQIYGDQFRTGDITLEAPSIVAAENLTPRQLLALDRRLVRALVLEHAGIMSHVAILARSFNIPTLTGVSEIRSRLRAGADAIVDANVGMIVTEISPAAQRYYEGEQRKQRRRQARFAPFAHRPADTRDGARLEIAANVATPHEIGPAFEQGADGIGLFRTEMLFMSRDSAPSEDEQFGIYAQAARAASGRPVIIRTLDVGGDKPVPYLRLPAESNPFLGYRGVRIYSEHADVFMAQVRAILRASAVGQVWLMAPMIASLDEVRWIKAHIARAQAELKAQRRAFDPAMRVGIMIEVPSAALLIDQLAPQVDFFSIGTNDLAQYFLAVDRESSRVSGLCSTLHPAFLKLLSTIVTDARRHGRWVGMCGEMAREAQNLPLLVGLGLDEISTAAPEIPALKAAVSSLSASDCRRLLESAVHCGTVTEVEAALAAFRAFDPAHQLIDPELIVVGSDSASKEEAIKEMVDALYAAGRTDQPQKIEDAVWAREAQYSTGLGHGFAIPHCKTDAMTASSISVVRLKTPVEWQSVDGEPVRCVILLATRDQSNGNAHMKVFSKLARRLMHEEFRDQLLGANDPESVMNCLAHELDLSTER